MKKKVKKVAKVAKVANKATKAKQLSSENLLAEAISSVKKEYSKDEIKSFDQHDWYGALESEIDALLYEKKYSHLAPNYMDPALDRDRSEDEIILERLIFSAIQICQKGRRHKCDMYYDEAFGGYDGF